MLVVCTANQCRSPMAEALLARRLAEAGVPAMVASAGIFGGGFPASLAAVEVLAGAGLDLRGHRSREIAETDVAGARLVLAMAREHVREIVTRWPAAWPRAFTLKELVRRGEAAGGRQPGEALEAWLARVGDGRRRTDLLGASPEDDVADPIGGPPEHFARTVAELTDLVDRLAALLVPPAPE